LNYDYFIFVSGSLTKLIWVAKECAHVYRPFDVVAGLEREDGGSNIPWSTSAPLSYGAHEEEYMMDPLIPSRSAYSKISLATEGWWWRLDLACLRLISGEGFRGSVAW
jgi:hypothetical protein